MSGGAASSLSAVRGAVPSAVACPTPRGGPAIATGEGGVPGPTEAVPVQLPLIAGVPPRQVHRLKPAAPTPWPAEAIIGEFRTRVQADGHSEKTARDYASQLRTLLRIAARLAGGRIDLLDLFGCTDLLGRALASADRPDGTGEYSGYATDGRRSAARRFARLFRREIAARHGEPAEALLDRALRSTCRRIGARYRSPVQRVRRRGGRVATAEELRRLDNAIGGDGNYAGLRDRAALRILAETGCRVNALRTLDGRDCHVMADDHLRILVRAKGRPEPAEYHLSAEAGRALVAAADAFTAAAPRLGLADRAGPGVPGPVFRSARGAAVSYDAWRRAFGAACAAAGVPLLRLHDLRRTFATAAESRAGRHLTALAGWWDRTLTMDRHYVCPLDATVDAKMCLALGSPGPDGRDPPVVPVPLDVGTPAPPALPIATIPRSQHEAEFQPPAAPAAARRP
jgi:integrase